MEKNDLILVSVIEPPDMFDGASSHQPARTA